MLRFEIKKIFSKPKNKIAVVLLFVVLIITSILTINRVEYVDENGNHSVGISASHHLREAKNEWAGYLTEDTLRKVIDENKAINNSNKFLIILRLTALCVDIKLSNWNFIFAYYSISSSCLLVKRLPTNIPTPSPIANPNIV